MKSILFAALALLGTAVSGYDLLRQCDSRWSSDILGTSGGKTICDLGGAVSSLAMILDDCDQDLYGFDVNPGSLNKWLKENNGFTNGNQIVWSRTDSLTNGVKYVTVTSSDTSIKYYLDLGDAALLRVSNEPHYVLGYGYTGSTYFVLDPRNVRRSYKTSEVIEAVIYSRPSWCKS